MGWCHCTCDVLSCWAPLMYATCLPCSRLLVVPLRPPLFHSSASKTSIKHRSFFFYYSPAARLIRPLNWASGRQSLSPRRHQANGHAADTATGSRCRLSSDRVAGRLPRRPRGWGAGSELFLSGWRKSPEAVPHSLFPPTRTRRCLLPSSRGMVL